MRNSKNHLAVLVLALALAFAACGDGETETSDRSEDGAQSESSGDAEDEAVDAISSEPPPVTLTRDGNTISLNAWTYCWTASESEDGICADGIPPEPLETLAGEGPIDLTFPADFTFIAVIYDADYANEIGTASVRATDIGWQIDADIDGPAVLEIFGNGQRGDVIVSAAIG